MMKNCKRTFISTECLADVLEKESTKIIDLRNKEKYDADHIKGSIYVNNDVFVNKNEDGVNILPEMQTIAHTLQEKGINNSDTIIFVDDVFNLNCSLAAWTLHYFGFKKVKLLDGAFAKWIEEDRPLTTDQFEYPKGDLSFKDERCDNLITKDEIMINLQSQDIVFVDNRSEYAVNFDQQGGNIPGAIHYWYLDLFEEFPDYFILKKLEFLDEDLKSKGITKEKTVVVYCESAPQSALVYLALKDLGYPCVKLYLAGYDEWRLSCVV